MIEQVLRIRDYQYLATERPEVDAHPDNVMLPEQYDVLMNKILFDPGNTNSWYWRGRQLIQNIRSIRNANPAFAIDDIDEPEPDPVDYYYNDEGYWYRTKDPNPSTPGLPADFSPAPPPMMNMMVPSVIPIGGIGLPFPKPIPKPKPPFPPFPPPGPIWPPVYWRPPAEETWSYCYRLNELVHYYVDDMQITPLEFQYWGYFLGEFLKNLYCLYRFENDEATTRSYFLSWTDLLEKTLPTR
jgi:hypothetical protein